VGASIAEIPIVKVEGTRASRLDDAVAVEEPLEIRLAWAPASEPAAKPGGSGVPAAAGAPGKHLTVAGLTERSISVTMRTPGHDLDLAVGFLLSEGIVRAREDIATTRHCGPAVRDDGTSNVVRVELALGGAEVDVARLERHFYTTSSCGVCGKTSLEAVRAAPHAPLVAGVPAIPAGAVHGLPAALRAAQETFARTGGLHAAALFDVTVGGRVNHAARALEDRSGLALRSLREDVGRHNAVDKVLGDALLTGALPLGGCLLMVSGRASFELVQKAVMAGVPALAAVGAPSSLAVDLARAEGMTLLGFVRDGRFNVYAGEERVGAGAEA